MITFAVALVVALVCTPVVIWSAQRWRLIDVPNERSSHVSPVPRGGGIAVVVGSVSGFAVTDGSPSSVVAAVVAGALVLGAMGLVDDRIGLPALPRLAVQLLAPMLCALVVADHSGWRLVVGALLIALWVAAFVNAFNFMDGINGISGSQAAIAGLALSIAARGEADDSDVVALGLAIAGASLGFLPFNVPRARIFLGDVGSYFMGFWLAGTAVVAVELGVSPLVVVGPFVIYLCDTGTVIVRRLHRGESLTQAHREHVYQRLVLAGMSHTAVTSVCALGTLLCSALMLAVADASLGIQVIALVICGFFGAVYLMLPAFVSPRSLNPPEVTA
jgi:UDP-N-acetylmuramyl pentapeptide phosphotransferase/UDP-N-acetylglucosamine-1-phosphate transferase